MRPTRSRTSRPRCRTWPKELRWIEGAGHLDLYDKKDEYVAPAIAELAAFFHARLASTP
ncbi:hypothetical protein [Streptomyces liliifuscus]|uniref:Alpha/beta hydrolase n=1 Tax=Streptomyces liliifuscus TaxID=2797636 RepID=A0A7T7I0B8_9ACTN|nr:hypothetical protein [Streptomyces liliifuscus]QQM38670.1 hypothetical protein JEQ17_03785 [Streptomyces liliifuscus]